MQMIHTSMGKSKKRKPNAKQRQLQADWEALLKKYETKPVMRKVKPLPQSKPFVRETPHIPSLNSGFHDCAKKESPRYTGTAMKGIGTMHKSNSVPIFSTEQAIEIATMRRN